MLEEKKKLIEVTLAEDATNPESWVKYEVEDLCKFLSEKFDKFPETGRIYLHQVATMNDVTPSNEETIEKLQNMEGPFFVVIYPADPVTAIITIVAVVVGVAAALLLTPSVSVPTVSLRNTQTTSPNNELSERVNKARPKARIPDIYGTVYSTPDLIASPYSFFINHLEVENSYMCVGRGAYEINPDEIYDDTTKVNEISGSSVEIYGPNTSPNLGTPQISLGAAIATPVWNAKRFNSVNGQVLRAPNDLNVVGNSSIRFTAPNLVQYTGSDVDFTRVFAPGDTLTVANASYTGTNLSAPPATWTVDLAGTYTITAVTTTQITLSSPAGVNADWNNLSHYTGSQTGYISPTLTSTGTRWVGPFLIDSVELEQVWSNFVALNGLYKDNGTNQSAVDITVEVEATPVNSGGSPIGSPETLQLTIQGSAITKDTRAGTMKFNPTFTGRCSVRARRVTDTDLAFAGTVVDEVKWRDVYSMSPVNLTDFGNVTTVQTQTYATAGALVIKNRKLNMLVTRKLPQRISGSTFTGTLYPTRNAADILSAIALDPFIGNRTAAEIDFDNIYDTMADVEAYFDTELASEFSYTFDNDNLSFEEIAQTIANTVFCSAYRQGPILKLFFEQETADSVLLFNHRNKVPDGTETRTISFGLQNDNDGVEFDYIDPENDSVETYYVPEDQSATNPRKVQSVGIRSRLQAYFHAKRTYNKMLYQRVSTSFNATQEADLLVKNNRILVADNTRSDVQDGEIEAQVGLELTLSQDVVFDGIQSYTIFLQHVDGSVESIGVTAGSASNKVVLASPPSASLSLDVDNYARATYLIVGSADTREKAFLVLDKTLQSNFIIGIQAVNYDDRYYSSDTDYINGIVDIDGNLI